MMRTEIEMKSKDKKSVVVDGPDGVESRERVESGSSQSRPNESGKGGWARKGNNGERGDEGMGWDIDQRPE
jgi:hypothetical protein